MTTHVQAGTMHPCQAAHVASRGRKLLRAGRITHAQFAILDSMLWSGRDRSSDTATISYDGIMKLAHCCRSTVAKTITRLVALGVVQKTKRKVLAIWNNGGRQWKQLPNQYRLIHCESVGQTDSKQEVIKTVRVEPNSATVKAAQDALSQHRAAWMAEQVRLLRNKGALAAA
jgi:hypothetical protein